MTSDYYELLGIKRDASDAEVKSAYKKAARKYHPDNSSTGNEELFKKVGEAYDVLKDPQKRTIYDQYGADAAKGAGRGNGFGGFGGAGGFEGAGFEDLGDIFSSFFGEGFGGFGGGGARGRSRNAPRKGRDHEVSLNIDFMDSVKGTSKKIQINPLIECVSCKGKGAENPDDIKTCSTCHGSGQVTSVQNTILGQIRQSHTCSNCGGSGQSISKACKPCKGKGYKRETKEVEITVPAGIQDGSHMRLNEMGDAGSNGGPSGDIYLLINVRAHDRFHRQGDDIVTELEIGFPEATLGTKLNVTTVHGESELKIKPGLQSGEVLTIKNEGMPKVNNPARRGDHYVKVYVNTPKNLSREEKKLIEKLKELRKGKDNKV